MADRTDIVQTIRARFTLVSNAENEQRRRELEDLRFDAGDQWADDVKAARGGQVVDGVPIPARPMLTINKLDQPVQLIINQMRNAHLAINIHADSEDADDDTAEVLQGLIRHIEVASRAQLARQWAYERGVKVGRGFWRINKRYVEESGEDFDQELVIDRILNQSSVYLDPFAQQPDWSDGNWAMVGGFVSAEQYKREFPDSKVSSQLDDDFAGEGDDSPDWMGETEDGQRAVRVMEYFEVQRTPQVRVAYTNARGQLVACWEEELPPDVPPDAVQQRRVSERRAVKWYKTNGVELLDEGDWDGQYIPIIPFVGREQNIDGKRRWIGIIHPSKDGQRLFNYSVSTAVETAALEPKAPFIGYEGQFEGHEQAWAQANIRNFPYLEVKPTTIGGQPAPLPQRNTNNANLGPSLALVQQADEYIKSTTFVYDPSLGSSAGSRSGRAVLALQQQADIGNSNYLDNLANISMTYEAKVLLDLIPKIYDRPGRVARILGVDDEAKMILLNAPFVRDPQTGRPMPAPMAMAGAMPAPLGPPPGPMPGPPMPAPAPLKVLHYNLAAGKYTSTVSVGKAYRTRVEQASDELGQVLQASPNLMPMIGDLYFKYRDFPGHLEIAKRMKKMLPPPLHDDDQPDPQALQAQLEQVQQQSSAMLQQMQAKIQELTDVIKAKQVEVQGQIEAKRLEMETRETIARVQAEAAVAVAQIKTDTTAAKALLDAEQRQMQQQAQHQHESELQLQKLVAQRQAEREQAMADALASPPSPDLAINIDGGTRPVSG